MALVPVTAATPAPWAPPVSRETPRAADDPWTMPLRPPVIPHAPRPLDAISAYREPFGQRPLFVDAYA